MGIVNIPDVGPVNFPDSMSQEDIAAAAGELYDNHHRMQPGEGSQLRRGVEELLQTGPQIYALARTPFISQEQANVERAALSAEQSRIATMRPSAVERLQDVSSVGTAAQWLSGAVGRNIPSLLPGVAGAIIGGIIGGPFGAAAGFGLGSLIPNTAESYMGVGEQASPGTAVAAGVVKSALDALPEFRLFRNLFRALPEQQVYAAVERATLREAARRGTLGNAGREALIQMGAEGATEGAQEVVDQLADRFVRNNWGPLTSDELYNVAESAIVGGVLGGGAGALGGARGARQGRQLIAQEEQQRQEAAAEAQQHEQARGDIEGFFQQRWQDVARAELPRGATMEDLADLYENGGRPQQPLPNVEPTPAVAYRGDMPTFQAVRNIVTNIQPGDEITPESIARATPRGTAIDPKKVNQDYGLIVQQLASEGLVKVLPGTPVGGVPKYYAYRSPNSTGVGAAFPQAARVAARLLGTETSQVPAAPRVNPLAAPERITPERIAQEQGPRFAEAQRLMAERDRLAQERRNFPQARSALDEDLSALNDQLSELTPERQALSKENVQQSLESDRAALAAEDARQARGKAWDVRMAQGRENAALRRETARTLGTQALTERLSEGKRKARDSRAFPFARSVIEANSPAEASRIAQEHVVEAINDAINRWSGNQRDINVSREDMTGQGRIGYTRLGYPAVVKLATGLSNAQERYTAMHEIGGHALRMLGKITDAEWAKITNKAGIQRMLRVIEWARTNGHPNLRTLSRALIEQHVLHNPAEKVYPDIGKQEAFAFYVEAALWAKDTGRSIPASGNILQRAIERIRQVFAKLTGLMQREPELFQRIESGEIAQREPAPSGADSTTYNPEAARAWAPRAQIEANSIAAVGTPNEDVAVPVAEIEKLNKASTDDFTRLRWWNKVINTPDYIASKYHEFRDYMQSKRAQERMRSEFMNHYLELMQPLNVLPREGKLRVTRLAEVAGAMQATPKANSDGSIRLVVPDYSPTFEKGKLNSRLMLSKPGDVLTLSKAEADAYFSKRKALDEVYDKVKESTLARFGLPRDAGPEELRVRSRALRKEADDLLAKGERAAYQRVFDDSRRALTAAGILESFDRSFLEAYTPHMRAGKAKLVIYQALKDANGNFLREADPAKQDNPLTRTVVIPFDGIHLNAAKAAADKYKLGLQAQYPASAGWRMEVKPNDMAALADDQSPTQRGINAIESLAQIFFADKRAQNIAKDAQGNVLTALDVFLDQLHLLEGQAKNKGFRAQLRHRRDNAGWLRAENADTYMTNAVGAYLVRASDHMADNFTYERTKTALKKLIDARRPDLYKYAREMEDYIHTPDRFTSMLKGIAFNWFLGFRLSSAFINFLQPLQSTIPTYAMIAGPRRSAMEVVRAAKDIAPAFLTSIPQSFRNVLRNGGVLAEETYFNWKNLEKRLPADEVAALRRGQHEGTLSNVMTHEQSGAVQPPVDSLIGRHPAMRFFKEKISQPLLRAAPIFFSLAEQQNRMSSFLSAYRLAKDPKVMAKIQKMAEASSYAGEVTDPYSAAQFLTEETNFMISKINRPVATRSNFGAIAGQFSQFPLAMFQLYARVLKGAGVGKTAAVSFLTMAAIGAMMTSGMWGLPGMADASDMLKLISRAIGPVLGIPEFDLEKSSQRFMSATLRSMGMAHDNAALTAEAFVKGPWRATMGTDIARRAGVNLNLADFFSTDATNLIGPAGSMIAGGVRDFMGYAANSQWPMAIAALLPMAARDMVKALEAIQAIGPGITSQATGNLRVPAHKASLYEAMQIATGFTPASYAREAERRDIAQGRGITAVREYHRQQLTDALILADTAQRDGRATEAVAARQRANAIRQNMIERSRGRPPVEQVWTPDTMRLVQRRVADARRGPADTAVARRRNVEERGVRDELSYFPK